MEQTSHPAEAAGLCVPDGTARIWSAATGKQLEVIAEPGGAEVYSAAFSPNGSEVVTSSATPAPASGARPLASN